MSKQAMIDGVPLADSVALSPCCDGEAAVWLLMLGPHDTEIACAMFLPDELRRFIEHLTNTYDAMARREVEGSTPMRRPGERVH